MFSKPSQSFCALSRVLQAVVELAGFKYTPIDRTEHNALTNSDLDTSLAENLNGGLGDLTKINQHHPSENNFFRMRGTGCITSPKAWEQGIIPKPDPSRRALEPATCLTMITTGNWI